MSHIDYFSNLTRFAKAFNRINELPRHFYIVNTKGDALFYNDTVAKFLSVNPALDLTSKFNSYDLIPANEADRVKQNNEKVLKELKPIFCYEPFTYASYETKTALSFKEPFRDIKRNIKGIIGISFIRSNDASYSLTNKLSLTSRQIDIMYYLIRGYTFRDIAREVHLSHRTVEHHVENLKLHFHCTRRSDLINQALKIDEIRFRLLAS